MNKCIGKMVSALLLLTAVLGFVSCDKNDEPSIANYELTLSYQLPDGLKADDISDAKLVLTKGTKEDTLVLRDMKAFSTTLPQGQYNLLLTAKVKDEANAYLTGTLSVDLYANKKATIELQKVRKSTLIFKEIYTTGGKKGYVLDNYFEIVNNSDEVQYLDGVILMTNRGGQTKEQNDWQANGYKDRYACGQGTVIAFPVGKDGKSIALKPGESTVIASDAVDHGKMAPEGNHCPDLSKAQWEVYIDNVKGEVDYPAPNMDIIFQNNKNMKAFGLGFFNGGYILAKLPAGITPKQFAADQNNLKTTPGTKSKMQYLLMPNKYVLDAVDMSKSDAETYFPQFLPVDDAKAVKASKAWEGKCLRRKVEKVVNGRAYFKDTNNSSVDFLNNQPLQPGRVFTEVDK
ncbi:DUF4876 domain-containing protein [Hoylesella buccalis]|uniref:DUF4876 domain-containing protein n=1 Tax=Hoylesella buccalis TaxID=28127 RepID=UPI003996C456